VRNVKNKGRGCDASRAPDARYPAPLHARLHMEKSDVFDKAIADFAVAYADQNERDHAALARAVRQGQVQAVFEEIE